MAVQVPRLNRFAPQAPESVGRIDANIPDTSKGLAMQGAAAEGLLRTVGDGYLRQQKHAADTAATASSVELDQYAHAELENAKRLKGDPTPVYKKFDEDFESKSLDILNKYKDASDITKSSVQEKLQEVKAKFYDRRTTSFSSQASAYEEEVTSSKIKITKNDMMDATAYIDLKDEKSLIPLELKLQELQDDIIKSGIKRGTVDQDADGNYVLTPSVKERLAKETSEGLNSAIENLLSTGRGQDVETAKFLAEKYKSRLDSVNAPKLNDKVRKATLEQEALEAYDKVRNLPFEAGMKKLGSIKDLEVRRKAETYLDSYKDKFEQKKSAASKETFNAIGKIILDRQRAGKAFTSVVEMESDPSIKRMIDKADPKQVMALHRMVTKGPEESDATARTEAYKMIFENGLTGVDPETIAKARVNLNDKDANYLESQWRKANNPTDAEEYRNGKMTAASLQRQLDRLNFIKKNDFGRYDDKNYDKLVKAQNDFLLQEMPPGLTFKEQEAYVEKFATDYAKGEAFKAPVFERPKFESKPEAAAKKPEPAIVPGVQPNPDDLSVKKEANRQFKNEKGRWPSPVELAEYMQKRKK